MRGRKRGEEGGVRDWSYLFDIVLDIAEVDALRRALEQDLAAVLHQGHGGEQDHDGDAHADGGIGIEAGVGAGEPDDDGGDDDAHVVEGVPEDVEHGAHHAEVAAGGLDGLLHVAVVDVEVGALGWVFRAAFRLGVVVVRADGGILGTGAGFGFESGAMVVAMVMAVMVVL